MPAVLADDDVARALHDAIIAPVLAAGRSGTTVLATVRRYLDNDRRLSETARELHTHVNTIRNRLARFEQLTGRDLRRSADLVETWWALRHSAPLGDRPRASSPVTGAAEPGER
jgi:DNA-binding PucR family transcriptional regulator